MSSGSQNSLLHQPRYSVSSTPKEQRWTWRAALASNTGVTTSLGDVLWFAGSIAPPGGERHHVLSVLTMPVCPDNAGRGRDGGSLRHLPRDPPGAKTARCCALNVWPRPVRADRLQHRRLKLRRSPAERRSILGWAFAHPHAGLRPGSRRTDGRYRDTGDGVRPGRRGQSEQLRRIATLRRSLWPHKPQVCRHSRCASAISSGGTSEAPITPLSNCGSISVPRRRTLMPPLGSKITAATSLG
ncbi:hypothetical protein BH23ACT6_BH23ACT6_03690 [soil metagenome]